MRLPLVRTLTDLRIVLSSSGVVALFSSTLDVANLRTKVSVWKRKCGVRTAQLQKLEEEEWLALRTPPVPANPADRAADPAVGAAGQVVRRSALQTVVELALPPQGCRLQVRSVLNRRLAQHQDLGTSPLLFPLVVALLASCRFDAP